MTPQALALGCRARRFGRRRRLSALFLGLGLWRPARAQRYVCARSDARRVCGVVPACGLWGTLQRQLGMALAERRFARRPGDGATAGGVAAPRGARSRRRCGHARRHGVHSEPLLGAAVLPPPRRPPRLPPEPYFCPPPTRPQSLRRKECLRLFVPFDSEDRAVLILNSNRPAHY